MRVDLYVDQHRDLSGKQLRDAHTLLYPQIVKQVENNITNNIEAVAIPIDQDQTVQRDSSMNTESFFKA
ncbi:MAG: hypothetical protein H0U71_03235 [Gammaproteobacteria bacterium]|nr:hypothetical protein [Gammaproteobacteria bacterium]